jgi:predicted PurR-regulated permease PerM
VINRKAVFWLSIIAASITFIVLIRSVLLPFVLGMLTAYFLDPAADRLQRLKLSRAAATTLITALFFVVITVLSLLLIPMVAGQISELLLALPGYVAAFETNFAPRLSSFVGALPAEQIEGIKQAVSNFSGVMVKWMADLAAGLFQSGMTFINLLSLILLTPLVTFYLLRDWDRIVAHIDHLLPRLHADTIRGQLAIIDATLAGFVRGQVNVCLILAVFYAFFLPLVAGLQFGVAIGLATGLLSFLPYVGFALGCVTGLAVAFFQFGLDSGFAVVAVIFLAGQLLESYFLTPKLVGDKVGLHPVWIIFGMLAGAALLGFVGVLLAIPITAIIGVLIRFFTAQYLASEYYRGPIPPGKPGK